MTHTQALCYLLPGESGWVKHRVGLGAVGTISQQAAVVQAQSTSKIASWQLAETKTTVWGWQRAFGDSGNHHLDGVVSRRLVFSGWIFLRVYQESSLTKTVKLRNMAVVIIMGSKKPERWWVYKEKKSPEMEMGKATLYYRILTGIFANLDISNHVIIGFYSIYGERL